MSFEAIVRGRIVRALFLLASALAPSCSDESAAPPAPRATGTAANPRPLVAHARPKSLLFLTLDTTRADRLGCYGYAKAETPNLDRLATNGVRFERAYTHVPLTLPSHASMFTGRLPPEHGLHDNGRAALAASIPTLAESFQKQGSRTGAFVSAAVLDSIFGLDRGFDVYDDRLGKLTADGSGGGRRRGEKTVDNAIAWLETDAQKPFFLWVHLFDPHAEYQPPSPFKERFSDPYDGEIAYMDREIGRLLSWLAARGLERDTLVVAVADHGESLGEHGERTHGILLYEATMHVPLLVAWPGGIAGGRVIAEPVQLVDLAPTILDAFGYAALPETAGQSLAPMLVSNAAIADRGERPVYGESEYCLLNFGWAPLHSLTTSQWKYVRSPKDELYHLSADPHELDECSARSAETAGALSRELDKRTAAMKRAESNALEATPEMVQRMAALGYVQSRVHEPDDDSAPARDKSPRENMPVLNLYHEGNALAQAGRFDKAIPKLEEAVKICPDAAGFRRELGRAYFQTERYDEAEKELKAALALDPLDQPAHFFLGSTYGVRERHAEALRELEAALELQPNDYSARQSLAWTLLQLDRADDAIREMQKLVELKPTKRAYRISLAQALREHGRHAEAVAALSDGLALASQDPELSGYLAWELATNPDDKVRDGKRAVELAERVCAVDAGKNAAHLDTLAAAYAEAGRFDDALVAIDEALRYGGEEARAELEARKALYASKRAYRDD